MTPETITITLPTSSKKRSEILRFLESKGLLKTLSTPQKTGKYAELARQYREEQLFDGHAVEVQELRKAFREDFAQ